jgi:hypothetical protein
MEEKILQGPQVTVVKVEINLYSGGHGTCDLFGCL